MTPPIPDEECSEALRLATENPSLTNTALGLLMWPGANKNSARQRFVHRIEEARNRGMLAPFPERAHFLAQENAPAPEMASPPPPDGPFAHRTSEREDKRDEKAGIWDATAKTTERITSLEELIAFFEVDTDLWDIETWTANKWEVATKDRLSSAVTVTPLYQVKARFRKKKSVIDARAEILSLLEDAKANAPVYEPIQRPRQKTNNLMLEISIFDAHFGKLCWSPETGDFDYDLRVAERLYLSAVETLISRTSAHRFSEIILPVGNDALNSEADGNTTGGTRQDNDGRHQKVFRVFRRAVARAIEMAREVAPVRVIPVPGNHDRAAIFYLSELLDVQFNLCPDVTIDASPQVAKYYRFGNVMLLFTHGSDEKHEDLPLLMATDQPEMWGATLYREAHIGHLHQTRVTVQSVGEKMGVRVRILPSLCPTDAWHRLKGYVNNLKGGEAFVWDGEYGLVENHHFTIPPYSPPPSA